MDREGEGGGGEGGEGRRGIWVISTCQPSATLVHCILNRRTSLFSLTRDYNLNIDNIDIHFIFLDRRIIINIYIYSLYIPILGDK